MTLRIEFTPKEEAWINGQASELGVPPDEVVRRAVERQLPITEVNQQHISSGNIPISAKNAAAIAYFADRIKTESTTDPREIQKAQVEYEELKRSLNANRAASGERLVFP